MARRDDRLTDLGIAAAAAEIRSGRLSPVDLADSYLERIARLNPAINAYVTVTGERARADARRAADEIAKSGPRGPLHGVPIALKDLCDTAGIRTTAGGKFFADRVPDADCTVARRLREAGSVLLGKLNTHEFAYGVTTDNPHFGATRNPWDPSRIPGGSSGGSGAAIAASLAAGTIGTDTGGSIRIPAALCGAVGLKPTYGRVSKAGIFPLSFLFDHAGPITRTVEDAAILLAAIAGYDAADPTSERVPTDRYADSLARDVKGLRIGVPRRYFYERLDPEVEAALESALAVLGSLGARVQDVDLPTADAAVRALFGLVLAEAKHIHAERWSARPHDFGADVAQILSHATPSGADLVAALDATYALTRAMRETLETVDVLATPTTPIPAVEIGRQSVRIGGIDESPILAMIRFTAPFNATRLPALSIPCGFTRGGLPIGLQLAGRPFDESTVLAVGHAYEQATDWHRRRPAP